MSLTWFIIGQIKKGLKNSLIIATHANQIQIETLTNKIRQDINRYDHNILEPMLGRHSILKLKMIVFLRLNRIIITKLTCVIRVNEMHVYE